MTRSFSDTGTRFGNMTAQMKNFIDQAGGLWAQGKLIGKVGAVFTSTATQHGGQESTILSFHTVLLHLGFVIVGLPYSFTGQMGLDEVMGNSPYGASTIAGGGRLASALAGRAGWGHASRAAMWRRLQSNSPVDAHSSRDRRRHGAGDL